MNYWLHHYCATSTNFNLYTDLCQSLQRTSIHTKTHNHLCSDLILNQSMKFPPTRFCRFNPLSRLQIPALSLHFILPQSSPMSLLFHRSLFGVFDIFLAIAGTAAGAYLYTQMLRRRQANHKTWSVMFSSVMNNEWTKGTIFRMALPSSPSKGKKRSSKSIRRVYSKK